MKLLRFGPKGAEKPGLLDDTGTLRDLSGVVADIAGDTLGDAGLARIGALDPAQLPAVGGAPRLGACVGDVGTYLAIGLNYSDHAAELNMPAPDHPVLFSKATSCICGAGDDVILPKGSVKTDWEVELGIVIGTEARHVSPEQAIAHVAGYCVCNDISERSFQFDYGGHWIKGKSSDTFGPIGPWLVTRDEVPDPGNLDIWLEVDGHRYQDGSTRTMVFGVAEIVSHLSRFLVLKPGDVICTGTPPGVGLGHEPPVFLRAGQTMRAGIDGLGVQSQRVVAYPG
jgi:2-keto-4-pentenoate hydratase/2-oxohepta-3-ene-1,7-dioic acid hydratase in catechol pathway